MKSYLSKPLSFVDKSMKSSPIKFKMLETLDILCVRVAIVAAAVMRDTVRRGSVRCDDDDDDDDDDASGLG